MKNRLEGDCHLEEVGYLDESTVCCGLEDGGLARGDAQGVCHLLDRTMRERCAFAAHERGVTHLLQPRGSTLLFSLGLELEGAVERTCMRVWRPEAATALSCSAPSRSAGCTAVPSRAGRRARSRADAAPSSPPPHAWSSAR